MLVVKGGTVKPVFDLKEEAPKGVALKGKEDKKAEPTPVPSSTVPADRPAESK
jgi:hypothetical protein